MNEKKKNIILRLFFLLLCFYALGTLSFAAKTQSEEIAFIYTRENGSTGNLSCTDSIVGENWSVYIAFDKAIHKKGLVAIENDTIFLQLHIQYDEVEFTSIPGYCWIKKEKEYERSIFDIFINEKYNLEIGEINQLIEGESDDHGKFISDGKIILFEDRHIISAPNYQYKIERDSTNRIKVLTERGSYIIDDLDVSSAWKVNSFVQLDDSIIGNQIIKGFVNDSVLISQSPDETKKTLFYVNEEAFDTLNLSRYSELYIISNTKDYLLCEENDTLLYILDWKNNKRHLLNTANLGSYGDEAAFLGERNKEPIFLIGENRLLGLYGFNSYIADELTIDPTKKRKPNDIFIQNSKSVGIWTNLDEIISGKALISIFDLGESITEHFALFSKDSTQFGSEFIYELPKLTYKAELKQHILFWISECISLSGGYEMLIPSKKTTERDVLDYYKSLFIKGFSIGKDIFDWGGYEASCTERILDTKEYASFVFDNSNHLGGGTGHGSSFATTFNKKTNRRLNLNDIVKPEARPVIENYLRTVCETYSDGDSLINTSVALGNEGINFIYGRYMLSSSQERYIVPYDIIEKWLKIDCKSFKENIPYKRHLTFEDYKKIDFEGEEIDPNVPHYLLTDDLCLEFPQKWHSNPQRDALIAKEINAGFNRLNLLNIVDSDPSKAYEICKWLIEENGTAYGSNFLEFDGLMLFAKITLAKNALLLNDIIKAKSYLEEVIQEPESYTTPSGYNTHIDAYRVLCDIAIKEQNLTLLADYQKTLSKLLTEHLRDVFPSYTRNIRNSLWERYKKWFFSEVQRAAYLTKDAKIIESAYDALLVSKGLLLNTEIALRKHINNSDNEELKEKYNRVERLRGSIKSAERFRNNNIIEDLKSMLSDAEAELMKEVDYSNYSNLQTIQMQQILKNLKPGEISIEFVDVEEENDTAYYALIIKEGDSIPKMKRLFTGQQLKSITIDDYGNGKLYDLVWNPLESDLKTTKTIFFSPSGKLYILPIEYAIKPETKECIYDIYNIHRLSSTREIVHERDTIFRDYQYHGTSLLIGGLNYDAVSDTGVSQHDEDASTALLRSAVSHRSKIRILPGTKEEIQGIVPYTKLLTTTDSVMVLTDSIGTEARFKQSTKEQLSNLHIATHGFYLTDSEYSKLNDKDFFSFLGQDLRDIDEKDLIRSGLVFAGVNQYLLGKRKPNDTDDGVLTTLEIGSLDLNNVGLAVLSACKSGEGDISSEGVFGLQRGFKKAGAKSLLMSLWKVNDDATKLLMIKFYEILSKTQDKHLALRMAQNYLRNYSNGKYDHPTFWAAFVLLDGFDLNDTEQNPQKNADR